VRVRLTPDAHSQLLEAVTAIMRDDPGAATKFLERAEKSLGKLADFPLSGRSLPEFPGLPYREVFAAPYRFFYRIEGDRVWVVALWHFARVPRAPSRELDWGPPHGEEVW
jgi:plasmid stabilization system protein ParE